MQTENFLFYGINLSLSLFCGEYTRFCKRLSYLYPLLAGAVLFKWEKDGSDM
jgi:hypothetical protein